MLTVTLAYGKYVDELLHQSSVGHGGNQPVALLRC